MKDAKTKSDVLKNVQTVYDVIKNDAIDYDTKGIFMRSLVEDIVYDKKTATSLPSLHIVNPLFIRVCGYVIGYCNPVHQIVK